jgi:hypothetical protein
LMILFLSIWDHSLCLQPLTRDGTIEDYFENALEKQYGKSHYKLMTLKGTRLAGTLSSSAA